MSRKYRSKRGREKLFERIFIGLLAVTVVLVAALIVMLALQGGDTQNVAAGAGYVVTADGHVHDTAGNHLGDYDEMIANGTFIVTGDGHVHDAAGNHIDVPAELLDGHDAGE